VAKPAPITDEQEPDEREVADNQASQAKLDRFLRAFDTAASPQQEIRARALQARRFAFIPGAQWEGAGWEEFSENMIRVEVNKTRKGLRKIFNDYRANRVTVDFRPVGDADEDTAETLDGRFRADAYRSQAGLAFDNAFDEGTSGGMGAWRLCNDWEDPYDPDNDNQVINFELIADADQSVFFDPNSKRYDKTDAEWGCVITAVARQAFEDEYGANRITEFPQGLWKPFFDWFAPDVVRVADWYQVEEKTERLWILTNAITDEEERIWASDISKADLDEKLAGGWKQRGRSVKRRRVHKYKLSGGEILKDCGYIAGPNIPIIVYYGERRFIDNQEHFDGHVQASMDPQRIYNSQVSRLVETAGSSPIARPIVTPSQMQGHSDDWARAGKDRLPFVYLNPLVDEAGNEQPLQQPPMLMPPPVDANAAALLQLTGADIAELTDADDGADEVKSNVSHEAMDLAATRTDEKSSGFMDNFRLSMEWCGRVYLGMAKEIYVEEGREIETRGAEGEMGTATLMQPKADNDNFRTINDFSQGKFNVIADVTESSATKRDKTVRKALGVAQIAGAETPLGQAALITAVSNMDGDGMDDFKKFTRRLGLQQGVFQPTEQEQQEAKEAAEQQGQAQPDPAEQALLARAGKDAASAELDKAKTQTEGAKTLLTFAQATALGGPEKAPEVPTGLEPAEQFAKVATGKLHLAQADKITHDIHLAHREHGLQRIRTGHEIEMERRAQDLAEKQPAAA
jgi:hypothetical protein